MTLRLGVRPKPKHRLNIAAKADLYPGCRHGSARYPMPCFRGCNGPFPKHRGEPRRLTQMARA